MRLKDDKSKMEMNEHRTMRTELFFLRYSISEPIKIYIKTSLWSDRYDWKTLPTWDSIIRSPI